MKLVLAILFIAATSFVNSCSKPAIELKEGILELPLKNCAKGTISENKLTLCFDSLIADSRCPANAICIWQGTATARFSLTKNKETVTFVLSTLNTPPTYIKDTILLGYKIEFINLSPYPGTEAAPVPNDKIKAEIKITKQ